jgi:hypothetical protein
MQGRSSSGSCRDSLHRSAFGEFTLAQKTLLRGLSFSAGKRLGVLASRIRFRLSASKQTFKLAHYPIFTEFGNITSLPV